MALVFWTSVSTTPVQRIDGTAESPQYGQAATGETDAFQSIMWVAELARDVRGRSGRATEIGARSCDAQERRPPAVLTKDRVPTYAPAREAGWLQDDVLTVEWLKRWLNTRFLGEPGGSLTDHHIQSTSFV
jgi:hypothetical protein